MAAVLDSICRRERGRCGFGGSPLASAYAGEVGRDLAIGVWSSCTAASSAKQEEHEEKFKLIRRCCCFRSPRTRAGIRVRKQPIQPRHGAFGLLRRASAPASTAAPRWLLKHRVQQRWGGGGGRLQGEGVGR
uniref:Uncharacterized protein n=1 Tax=Triticum urartu TaxID=4572 RepID=A0A8R7QSQ4_TRIUA